MDPCPRRITIVLFALLALALSTASGESSAQTCGGEGQGPCGLTDCRRDLVLVAGKCRHPDCGRDGQRPCTVTERFAKSCDDGLVELPGMCGVRGACGAEGQRPCLVIERVPSCNSKNLVESGGKCIHPACGRLNERACGALERAGLSCDETLVEIAGKCQARNSCGAEGQRACTVAERTPSCNVNLAETAAHMCIHPDCGRIGQRACPGTERPGIGKACDAGLTEAPGCTGDCRGSSSMCFDRTQAMTEPTTNSTPLPPDPANPLRGFADLHVHMFANLAFGGGVLYGAPYDPIGGIAKALGPDYGTDLDLVSFLNTPVLVHNCPPLVPNCGRNIFHGDHTPADDTMSLGTGDASKSYFGAPIFNGWPTWHTTTHQQVYYRWLERAWRGGMRVMVMLAVNNEFACATSKHLRGTNCSNSMPGIDAQLDAAKAFEAWHARQAGGGWFKIVTTPDEAEAAIRAGKLAVVLGIEADTLFGCKQRSSCTNEFVAGQVDKYYDKGVRYIFPVHDFDGGFAGTALFMDPLGAANVTIEGVAFTSAPCPGISDKGSLNCNIRGLTPGAGPALLNKLMDKGMMIDIDHMSAKAIDETFAIAKSRGNYPLFVGHGLFNEVYAMGKNRHERMRTKAQLETLKALGGVVSVMTQDELTKSQTACTKSSVSFADNYRYAVSKMDVVAFGSDFNGMAGHVGPRFGDDACGGEPTQKSSQAARLPYPFTIPGFGVFQKQVTGQRTFDFNVDGMAHIGLYPDLLADLTLQGVSIEPLMKSAGLFVSAWRKAAQPRPALAPLRTAPPPPVSTKGLSLPLKP